MHKYLTFVSLLFASNINVAQTPKVVFNSLGLIAHDNKPIGTAFSVSPNRVVTAAHNLYNKINGQLIDINTLSFTCLEPIKLVRFKILKLDTCYDFAVLEVEEGTILNYLTKGSLRKVNKSEKVKYYGFDFKASEKFGIPQVTSYSSFIDQVNIRKKKACQVKQIQFRGRAYFGFSGGPILNSKNEVIGFISSGLLDDANTVIFGYPVPEF